MRYADWGAQLSAHFPTHDAIDASNQWELTKQGLAIGQPVKGYVVAKAPFGAWLDIGKGFPALLELPSIAGLTPEHYRDDDWCPVGTEVKAFVGTFNDRNRQIKLTQIPSQLASN